MRIVNVIPTYNERENIEETLSNMDCVARLVKKHKWSTLVVDDNSPDGTGELVSSHRVIRENKIVLLTGEKNGLGVAMARGIEYAITKMKAEIVITNEADLAYEAKELPKLISKIEQGWDVVVGSRHIFGGDTSGWSWHRRLNHFIANTLCASWIAGVSQVSDHNGALRAVRIVGVQAKLKIVNWPTGFGFFNYWLARLTLVTQKIIEIPIHYRFRTKGESKVSFNSKYVKIYLRDVWEYVRTCIRIRRELRELDL